MKTDTEIRAEGYKALSLALGDAEAERFIAIILREPFDYTKWQRQLWDDKGVAEISRQAMAYRTRPSPAFSPE